MVEIIDKYQIVKESIKSNIVIVEHQPINKYYLSRLNISKITQEVLYAIKDKIVNDIGFEVLTDKKKIDFKLKEKFKFHLKNEIGQTFKNSSKEITEQFYQYLLNESLGYGEIEYLLEDPGLEEIVINKSGEPIKIYHKKHGWLETNIIIQDEARIRHFATLISRNVNKDFTQLNPLLDAHLLTGDRVNATLSPITDFGNTITIRKFSRDPWSITKFIQTDTITPEVAAFIWQAMEYEESMFVVGGTGSGKTSMLNVLSNFFPPSQRVISIEDTRELQLPKTLHWVPMATRAPNPEGKGKITLLDCMVNTLRMRPDRIILGEVRRKEEVEVLFESIRTGHSGYATFHAATVGEMVARLTSAPISLPKIDLASLGLAIVQFRDRRKGQRRTFQVAEFLENGDYNILYQYNTTTESIDKVNNSIKIYNNIKLFSGLSDEEIAKDYVQKIYILKLLEKKDIKDVHTVGKLISEYYWNKEEFLEKVGFYKGI